MREIKFRAWDNIAGRFKTGTEAYEQEIHKLEAELEKRQSSDTWGRE